MARALLASPFVMVSEFLLMLVISLSVAAVALATLYLISKIGRR